MPGPDPCTAARSRSPTRSCAASTPRTCAQGLALCRELNRRHPDYAYGWYLASFLMKKARQLRRCAARDRPRPAARRLSTNTGCTRPSACSRSGDVAGGRGGRRRHCDGSAIRRPAAAQRTRHAAALSSATMRRRSPSTIARSRARCHAMPEHHFNRAAVQRYFGDIGGAEAGFDAAIAINPDEYEAYNGRAHVRTQTRERNHVEQLRRRDRAHARPGWPGPAPLRARQGTGGHGGLRSVFRQPRAAAPRLKRRHMQYSVETDLADHRQDPRDIWAGMFDGRIAGLRERRSRSSSSACRAPARRWSSAYSAAIRRCSPPAN